MSYSTEQLAKARAELTEAYDRIYEELQALDTVHDLVGDALARVKALQYEEEKNERVVHPSAS